MRIYLDEIKCRMIRNGEMYDYTKTKIPVREKIYISWSGQRKNEQNGGLFTGQH